MTELADNDRGIMKDYREAEVVRGFRNGLFEVLPPESVEPDLMMGTSKRHQLPIASPSLARPEPSGGSIEQTPITDHPAF